MTKRALPENLTLQLPRAEAARLPGDVAARGKKLLRRTADPSAQTAAARELNHDLHAWGADSVTVMAACFGPPATDLTRASPMRYTTLDKARDAVRRLALLREAHDLAGRLRKAPGKTGDKPPAAALPRRKPKEKPGANQPRPAERPYHFCLSFAGEDRKYAEELHALLTKRDMTAFYDEAEQHKLWGRNLYEHLADVYEHQAHFCVMFASRFYVKKAWTRHERESAQAPVHAARLHPARAHRQHQGARPRPHQGVPGRA